jgi:prepilin-type processing-associated H-X9-DG protein
MRTHAFTRLELLACIFGCGLIMAVILPGLANSTTRSDQAVCVNNLRQIGVAYANFGLEKSGGRMPWTVPPSEGGTFDTPLGNNSFVQFSVLSNFLAHPSLLVDPGDDRRNVNPARHWGLSSGGLWNPAHQNNAISYALGLHGDFRMPRSLLASDRNLLAAAGVGGCSSGIAPATQLDRNTVRWTNAVHGFTGNLLFFDGSVEQTESTRMRALIFFGLQDDVLGGTGQPFMHILTAP